jgi:hypothetical protein
MTKLTLLNARRAIRFFDDRASRNLRLMHIESDDAFVVKCYQFHLTSIPVKLQDGKWRVPELNMPEGDKSPMACLTGALQGSNPGYESVQRVTLDSGCHRQKIAGPPPATFHPIVSFIIWGGASRNER